MKILSVVLLSFLVFACSERQVEEWAFRTTLEYDLIELCGANDKECIRAVKAQTKECMEKSDWRTYLKSQNDQFEMKRFTGEFYSCIVDSEGNPYFEPTI